MPSALQVFASVGGLSLLAEHLPILYPEVSRVNYAGEESAARGSVNAGTSTMTGHDWITVESPDDLYDVSVFYSRVDIFLSKMTCVTHSTIDARLLCAVQDLYEPLPPPSQLSRDKQAASGASMLPSIPPHSLVSFGVFLRLPGYADVLLKERRKAQCLLRLVLGVTDDGEGGTPPPLRHPYPRLTDYNIM